MKTRAPSASAAPTRSRARQRKVIATIAVSIVTVAIVTAGGLGVRGAMSASDVAPTPDLSNTEPVQSGKLSAVTNTLGTLTYTGEHEVYAGAAGTVTWLPGAGSTVELGGRLDVIDNHPAYLFYGGGPAWRPFATGMVDGSDVRQLEQSLQVLGFFERTPDDHFDWRTTTAIEKWQKTTGQDVTGSIGQGTIVFAPDKVRIATVDVAVGAGVAPGVTVLHVSGLDKIVTANVSLANQLLAVTGGAVTVSVPGVATVKGVISTVGTPTVDDSGPGKGKVIPIMITLADQAGVASMQQADVIVGLPNGSAEEVLYVPVDALLAVDGGGFGVQIDRGHAKTEILPVTTGLFVAGNVAISGDGIKAGDRVVVPKR